MVTSPSGAALRDVLSVLRRRSPNLPVLLYPVPVQGDGAAERIAAAIRLASKRQDCDVLLLARGGGSLEDLQAFNEESSPGRLSTAPFRWWPASVTKPTSPSPTSPPIYARPPPRRRPDYSSPDRQEWLRATRLLAERLERALRRRLSERRQRLHPLAERLARLQPHRRFHDRAQRLDELDQRLRQALNNRLDQAAAAGRTRKRAAGAGSERRRGCARLASSCRRWCCAKTRRCISVSRPPANTCKI